MKTERNVLLVLLACAALLPLAMRDQYLMHMAIMVLFYTVLATSLNLLVGYVGEFSLGHTAFLGMGAYTAALCATQWGWPLWATIPAAGAVACVTGLVVGGITLRLQGPFFVIVTLSFAEILRLVAANWIALTNGPMGIAGVPQPAVLDQAMQQVDVVLSGRGADPQLAQALAAAVKRNDVGKLCWPAGSTNVMADDGVTPNYQRLLSLGSWVEGAYRTHGACIAAIRAADINHVIFCPGRMAGTGQRSADVARTVRINRDAGDFVSYEDAAWVILEAATTSTWDRQLISAATPRWIMVPRGAQPRAVPIRRCNSARGRGRR